MCLSDAFELVNGERRPVMNYVSGISVDENGVTLTDMLGANRSGILALMVEPAGGAVTAWQKVLHALQSPWKAACRRNP